MSILAFLSFTSVIYLVSASESNDAPPSLVSSSDQLRVNAFISDVAKLYDEHLAEAFASDKDNEEFVKYIFLDGIGGFINYIFYQKQHYNQTAEHQWNNDDVIVQYRPMDSDDPVVPYQQASEGTEEDLASSYSEAVNE